MDTVRVNGRVSQVIGLIIESNGPEASVGELVHIHPKGKREIPAAYSFIRDLRGRLANRVQLATDGSRPYLTAVESVFGGDVDYAQLVKLYSTAVADESRCSPPRITQATPVAHLRKPRREPDLDVLRREAESDYPDASPAVHPFDQRFLEETIQPQDRFGPSLRPLQLRACSLDAEGRASGHGRIGTVYLVRK